MLNGLLSKGLKVLRIGMPIRMHSEVRSVCLQSHIESHSLNAHIQTIQERIHQIHEELKKKRLKVTTPSIRRARRKKIEKLLDEKAKLLAKKEKILGDIQREILLSADVVCATLIGCGNDAFAEAAKCGKLHFCMILVDEASQTMEPSVLIPLIDSCSRFGRLVMIGDQKQLPPMIASLEAKRNGLDRTLFDRLIDTDTDTPLFCSNLLSVQYRMHPDIAAWPNAVIYGNQITNSQSTHSLKAFDISGFVWPHKKHSKKAYFEESPLIFVDVCGKEQKQKNGHFSVSNLDEAGVVVSILQSVNECNQLQQDEMSRTLSSIGIISGYKAQCALIQRELQNLYGANSEILDCIEIESVDGFQGKEKDLIILSCVRSNERNEIGFMRDERRMNVALSRARRGLIVIGNAKCLANADKYWRSFVDFMRKTGRIVDEKYIEKHLKKTQSVDESNDRLFIASSDDNNSIERKRVVDIDSKEVFVT